jgi:multidrug efflux system outer membrane protein
MNKNNMSKIYLGTLLVYLLSGCSLIPEQPKVALPVASAYPQNNATKPNTSVKELKAVDIAWKDFFKDERLQKLIEITLENNKDYKTAALKIEELKTIYDIQKADSIPSINGNAGVSRNKSVNNSNPTNSYQIGLGLASFELDFFNRVKSLNEAALNQYFATEEAQKSLTISLVSEVSKLYLEERALNQLVLLAKNTLETREKAYKISKKRFELGDISDLDVKSNQVLVESAKLALLGFTRQQNQSINGLVLLSGKANPFEGLPNAKEFNQQNLFEDIQAGLPSELLENRPDIKASEYQLKSANANIGAAKAAFFPRISLTASTGLASTQLGDLFKSGSFIWSVGPQLTIPIFDVGRNKNNLKLAEIRTEQSIIAYEKAIQTAFKEVADSLAIKATIKGELEAQNNIKKSHAERLRLSNIRYKYGIANYIEVLDAERDLFSAEQSLVQLQLLDMKNTVDIYKSLGGGLKKDK